MCDSGSGSKEKRVDKTRYYRIGCVDYDHDVTHVCASKVVPKQLHEIIVAAAKGARVWEDDEGHVYLANVADRRLFWRRLKAAGVVKLKICAPGRFTWRPVVKSEKDDSNLERDLRGVVEKGDFYG